MDLDWNLKRTKTLAEIVDVQISCLCKCYEGTKIAHLYR